LLLTKTGQLFIKKTHPVVCGKQNLNFTHIGIHNRYDIPSKRGEKHVKL